MAPARAHSTGFEPRQPDLIDNLWCSTQKSRQKRVRPNPCVIDKETGVDGKKAIYPVPELASVGTSILHTPEACQPLSHSGWPLNEPA